MKDLISNYRVKPVQELVAQLKLKKKPSCADKMDLATPATPIPKVGRFLRDSIIQAPVRGDQVNEFYFIQSIINQEKINSLKFTRNEKYKSGALIYECRLYSMKLGDLKIFYNDLKKQVCRCKILNMYNKLFHDHLETRVDILLIDHGIKRRNVNVSKIFEIPTQVKDIMDIDPCANLARLQLDPPLPIEYRDKEVDTYFMSQLHKTKIANVKILDFVEGCYVVDLIDHRGLSLADHINDKFKLKFEEFERNHKKEQVTMAHCYELVFPVDPFVIASHHRKLSNLQQRQAYSEGFKVYPGAIGYFQQKERDILNSAQQSTTYSMLEQLHKVRVIYWKTVDTFYIIPNDTHYTDYFPWFKKQISRFQEYLCLRKVDENHEYRIGDWCLFKNDKDTSLGNWLRGVVVKTPKTSCGLLLGGIRFGCNETPKANLSTPSLDRASFVYEIRSIDFGFQCIRGADGLMPIPENHQLLKIPTWSMRCKLFGIYPFNLDNAPPETLEFSDHCNLRIASWMFERIANDEKYSNFYVLFRSRNLLDVKTYKPKPQMKIAITLFHKQVFKSSLDDCFKSKKRIPELDCLNYDLMQEGRADSYPSGASSSSFVDLDHHIVNTLIVHKFSQ